MRSKRERNWEFYGWRSLYEVMDRTEFPWSLYVRPSKRFLKHLGLRWNKYEN